MRSRTLEVSSHAPAMTVLKAWKLYGSVTERPAKKGSGQAKDCVEVIDVPQLLVRSVALKAARPNGAGAGAD